MVNWPLGTDIYFDPGRNPSYYPRFFFAHTHRNRKRGVLTTLSTSGFRNYAVISEAGTPRKLVAITKLEFHIGMTYHFLLVSEVSNPLMVSARPNINVLVVTSAGEIVYKVPIFFGFRNEPDQLVSNQYKKILVTQ